MDHRRLHGDDRCCHLRGTRGLRRRRRADGRAQRTRRRKAFPHRSRGDELRPACGPGLESRWRSRPWAAGSLRDARRRNGDDDHRRPRARDRSAPTLRRVGRRAGPPLGSRSPAGTHPCPARTTARAHRASTGHPTAVNRASGRRRPRLSRRHRRLTTTFARRPDVQGGPRSAQPVRCRHGRDPRGVPSPRPRHPSPLAGCERGLGRHRGADRGGARPDAQALRARSRGRA